MLMCDVLNEREQQLKIKKKKGQMKAAQEKEWQEFERQQREEADEKLKA
jgi:hypothetical protein